jgi:hypothetical protein
MGYDLSVLGGCGWLRGVDFGYGIGGGGFEITCK